MRATSVLTGAIVALLLAPLAAAGPAAGTYSESFEQGFGGWVPDHYIDCELNIPPCDFQWSIVRSQAQAYDGNWSLRAYLNGQHDDGTIWVERQFSYPQVAPVTLRMSFWLHSSEQGPVNAWPVVAFIGNFNPETEAHFTIVGEDNQVVGWKQYNHTATVLPGTVWIAFGFGATWETERVHYLDLVQVAPA